MRCSAIVLDGTQRHRHALLPLEVLGPERDAWAQHLDEGKARPAYPFRWY